MTTLNKPLGFNIGDFWEVQKILYSLEQCEYNKNER